MDDQAPDRAFDPERDANPYRPPDQPVERKPAPRPVDGPARLVASTRRWWRALGIVHVVFGGLMLLVGLLGAALGAVVAGAHGQSAPPPDFPLWQLIGAAVFGAMLLSAGIYSLIFAARLTDVQALTRSPPLRRALRGYFALSVAISVGGLVGALITR